MPDPSKPTQPPKLDIQMDSDTSKLLGLTNELVYEILARSLETGTDEHAVSTPSEAPSPLDLSLSQADALRPDEPLITSPKPATSYQDRMALFRSSQGLTMKLPSGSIREDKTISDTKNPSSIIRNKSVSKMGSSRQLQAPGEPDSGAGVYDPANMHNALKSARESTWTTRAESPFGGPTTNTPASVPSTPLPQPEDIQANPFLTQRRPPSFPTKGFAS